MTDPKTLLVLGAHGVTGQEVVAQAVAKGHRVRAAEMSWPEDAAPPAPGVERVTADVLKDDLGPVVQGVDAVISALGVPGDPQTLMDPPPLYTTGTRRLVEAMRGAGVKRLVTISASFVVTHDRGPALFRATAIPALTRVLDQMRDMEEMLRATDLDWTAVRPGWLLPEPLTAEYVVVPDVIPEDLIRTRHADLAHFMLHCAESGEWLRQTPAIAREEDAAHSSSFEVVREMLA
ncbi:NAD(P)-dependent oxidoreductase [Limimaricola pyoseonensis]|uniref:NAD(P)H-binding n=1 Tax=Limimaricola pyoseonensis TaxID=521013 RepID=A0A1G7CS23_9RHOB|nr:NAD(P)H-binding protein [Limimaricola pyoseonensis]SDE42152.1 NAD(P)H-binding [Limimaricola pyoseonensis]